MTARAGAWFFGSTPRRVAIVTALLAFLLMLPLALLFAGLRESASAPVMVMGATEIALLSGFIAGLRLPVVASGWRALIGREVRHGLAVAASIGVAITLAELIGVAGASRAVGSDSAGRVAALLFFGLTAPVAAVIAFVCGRALRYGWSGWNRLRRRRLRWALTHAVLVVGLALSLVAGTLLTVNDVGGNVGEIGTTRFVAEWREPGQRTLGLLVTRFVPSALALFLFSLLVGVLIVPPVAAISFPVVGRATCRLEELTAATAALREGELAARSPVSGEDEIARLQADFNAMAATLQRSQDELRAERDAVAALLDERRVLIAAVSHELRTPLATVRGYLDSALTHLEEAPPPTLRHDLEVMTGETERLERLIDDLFTLSRAEIGRLPLNVVATDVGPLLEHVAAAAAQLAWERGRVEVLAQPATDLPAALIDPARLEQAIGNLVANAVRHTPPGGLVLLSAEPCAGEVIVQVRDTGEGIAAADLPHVWDRFYRGQRNLADVDNSEREGAGLGLALVKELIEAMGGSVAVTSAPGEGSCFSLRLPMA